jgi:hypothetical protein
MTGLVVRRQASVVSSAGAVHSGAGIMSTTLFQGRTSIIYFVVVGVVVALAMTAFPGAGGWPDRRPGPAVPRGIGVRTPSFLWRCGRGRLWLRAAMVRWGRLVARCGKRGSSGKAGVT